MLLKFFITLILAGLLLFGCAQEKSSSTTDTGGDRKQALAVKVTTPEPLAVPEYIEPKSDTDWEAKVSNKNGEIIGILNIINPIAAFIASAFDQYGDKLSEITHEEWEDTGAQLGRASAIYDDCKKRMAAKKYNKQLFLDLEEAWQVFVKVGVAGVRTKSMVDEDLKRI